MPKLFPFTPQPQPLLLTRAAITLSPRCQQLTADVTAAAHEMQQPIIFPIDAPLFQHSDQTIRSLRTTAALPPATVLRATAAQWLTLGLAERFEVLRPVYERYEGWHGQRMRDLGPAIDALVAPSKAKLFYAEQALARECGAVRPSGAVGDTGGMPMAAKVAAFAGITALVVLAVGSMGERA